MDMSENQSFERVKEQKVQFTIYVQPFILNKTFIGAINVQKYDPSGQIRLSSNFSFGKKNI